MIKPLVVSCLATPPVWNLLRRRALRDLPLTVLCYHTVGPNTGGIDGWTVVTEDDFRAQLDDLMAHYDIVSLDDALAGQGEARRPQAVITFDDGDRGLHRYLLPILREHPVPVTIYVATGQFENNRPFWFDRVVNALQGSCEVNVNDLGHWKLPAEPGKERWSILGDILEALKAVPPDARDDLADRVAAQGKTPSGEALGPMTREQLKEMAATPGMTIGAHSHGHEILDQISIEQARESMARSRELLQDWTGQEVNHFAFPNGNHTPALCEAARSVGFSSASILGERLASRDNALFALPRISVGRYDSRNRVRLRLAGF